MRSLQPCKKFMPSSDFQSLQFSFPFITAVPVDICQVQRCWVVFYCFWTLLTCVKKVGPSQGKCELWSCLHHSGQLERLTLLTLTWNKVQHQHHQHFTLQDTLFSQCILPSGFLHLPYNQPFCLALHFSLIYNLAQFPNFNRYMTIRTHWNKNTVFLKNFINIIGYTVHISYRTEDQQMLG